MERPVTHKRQLTQPARDLIAFRIRNTSREELVQILEGRLSIQTYDHETVNDFVPSLLDSIEIGDISHDEIPATGGYQEQRLQDMIDELWEDEP
jgi:hypothetical protein